MTTSDVHPQSYLAHGEPEDSMLVMVAAARALLAADPSRAARLGELLGPMSDGDAAARLDALLDPSCWRIRSATIDPACCGRVRALAVQTRDAWLGLEQVLQALLERCAVVCHVDPDGAALMAAWRQLLVDAGLPPAALQITDAPGVPVAPARSRQLYPAGSGATQLDWLRATIRHAAALPFYRERFASAGLVDGHLADWDQFLAIPPTTRDELLRHGPPGEDTLLATPMAATSGAYVFTTGGSTGAPKYAIYGFDEWDEVTDIAAQQLVLDGIGPGDRVGNVFSPGHLWSAFIAIDIALRKIGCVSFPFGDMDAEDVLTRCHGFGVTALIGTPSVLMRLAHASEAAGVRPQIAKLIFAGEHLTEGMSNYLQEVFAPDAIRSVAYSAIDAGVIGFQPAGGARGVYHALANHAVVEICDPLTGQPVGLGEEGEVVVTNHARRRFPVIRLRTGDTARRLDRGRFELRGRNDDKLRVAGGNLYVSDVDRLCSALADELAPVYQLRLGQVGPDDRVEVVIETRRPVTDDARAALAARVRSEYLRRAPHLAQLLDGGLLRHFSLQLVAPGTLPLNPRTGKIRRVVDTRLDAAPAPNAAATAHRIHLPQSFLYQSPHGGAGWLAVVGNPEYQDAPETLPLDGLVARIAPNVGHHGLEVVGLGCGDGKKEVRLVESLGRAEVAVRALRLLDVGEVLLAAAAAHAHERLTIAVDAIRDDVHHLGRHLASWRRDDERPPTRLYAMFGGTFSNMDDELAFMRETLGAAAPGDLLLLDVSPVYAPAHRPDEIARLDPRLALLGETGLRGPELAWLGAALDDYLRPAGQGAAEARVRVRINHDCCPVPGSYAVDLVATIPLAGGGEREVSLMYIKRYDRDGLVAALAAAGWQALAIEAGIGRGLVGLFQRQSDTSVRGTT